MKIAVLCVLLAASVAVVFGARFQSNKNAAAGGAKRELLRNKLSNLLKSALDKEVKRDGNDAEAEDKESVVKDAGFAKKHERLRALFNNMKKSKLLASEKQSRGSEKQKTDRSTKPEALKKRGNFVGKKISGKRGKTGNEDQFKRMKAYFTRRAESIEKKDNDKRDPAGKRYYDETCSVTCEDCYNIFTEDTSCPYEDYYTNPYDYWDYPSYGSYGSGSEYDFYNDFDDIYYQCSTMLEHQCGVVDEGPSYDCSCDIPCYYEYDYDFDWCVLDTMCEIRNNYATGYNVDYNELDCLLSNLFTEIDARMNMWLHYGLTYYENVDPYDSYHDNSYHSDYHYNGYVKK